jgi:hypothetical protein
MKQLNESQKDLFNVIIPVALFWAVMSFFISTTPNYLKEPKAPEIETKHVQSKVLDAYGKVLLKNFERCNK